MLLLFENIITSLKAKQPKSGLLLLYYQHDKLSESIITHFKLRFSNKNIHLEFQKSKKEVLNQTVFQLPDNDPSASH